MPASEIMYVDDSFASEMEVLREISFLKRQIGFLRCSSITLMRSYDRS